MNLLHQKSKRPIGLLLFWRNRYRRESKPGCHQLIELKHECIATWNNFLTMDGFRDRIPLTERSVKNGGERMPRGKEQNDQMRKDTMERITQGALAVFAEYGFYGATMRKISDASELSYGLVYHYFKSKEEVFTYLVNDALDKALEVFKGPLNVQGTAWEKLTSLSNTLLKESLEGDSALYYHIMLQALTQGRKISELKERIDRSSENLFRELIPIIVQAQGTENAALDEPMAMAIAYLSLVQGLALFHFQQETISRKITPDILLNVLRRSK
jgi:AcrR family transcriptional regulator